MLVYSADLLNWEGLIENSLFRGFLAFLIALILSLVLGGKLIEFLREMCYDVCNVRDRR